MNLLPCPFCGSDWIDITKDPKTEFYFVFCHRCKTEGKSYIEREMAIHFWNNPELRKSK